MPELIDGFSQVEYLTVFNAIIFGVIASEFFNGWGTMVRYRDTIKIYWLHLAWSIFAFLTLIQNWFANWPRTHYINDSILTFLWSLVPMFLFHLISVIIFPGAKYIDNIDFKQYYIKNARALYLVFGIYLISTIIGPLVYKDVGNVLEQNILRLTGIALCFTAVYFKKTLWYQALFLILMYIGLIVFVTAIPK